MLWKLILAILAFFHPSGRENTPEWVPLSSDGPQTREDADRASQALRGDLEGGDILVNEDNRHSGDGIKDDRFRWLNYPGNGTVPYVIDPSLDSQKALILKAMDEYHKKTPCIKFVPRNQNHRDYIHLTYGQGCNSYVGRQGGRQIVNLGDGCHYVGTIIHELGHAIGFHHEHQRSDRDTYIYVVRQNVIPEYRFAVDKTNKSEETILTDYDYDSIMHYGNFAFSIDPSRLYTLLAWNRQILKEPYDKTTFTAKDITAIKKLYKCR